MSGADPRTHRGVSDSPSLGTLEDAASPGDGESRAIADIPKVPRFIYSVQSDRYL